MFDKIPQEMKDGAAWCLWKYECRAGKPTKPPYSPHTRQYARPNDINTFSDFKTAVAAFEYGGYEGLGIGMFNGFCAIDIDHCIEDGKLSPMAAEVVQLMDSYTEISPSGAGIRIIFRAHGFVYDKKQYYTNNQAKGLEVYIEGCTKKYVTITGNTLEDKPIAERSREVLQVLENHMRQPDKKTPSAKVSPESRIIEKAKAAKNSAAFSRLWEGDTTGYKSGSEADLALCNMLAFWTGRDAGQMDTLFRQSGLMRDKWDREDYSQTTIAKAIADCADVYTPEYIEPGGLPELEGKQISLPIVEAALSALGITVKYNQLLKELEIIGLPMYFSNENAENVLPVFLMDYLKEYKVKGVTVTAVNYYLTCVSDKNRYNPLKPYLSGETWDNEDRITLLYGILGVTDPTHCTYIKKWLIQCVALALNDDDTPIGAEGVLVLLGPQGIAKTSFFRMLSPFPRWFVEGAVIDVSNKDTIIKAVSGWLCELGELDSTLRKEQSSLKAFITSTDDRIRMPYAKNMSRSSRRTSFCGTVNQRDYLRDETGSRRFWTIPVENINKKVLFSLSRAWVRQLWVQVYGEYKQDNNAFRLTDDEMKTLQSQNKDFTQQLPYESEIWEMLDFSLPPEKWEWWKASEAASRIRGNPTSKQVGRALAKITQEAVFDGGYLMAFGGMGKEKRSRKYQGYYEYLLPLEHFRWDRGSTGGFGIWGNPPEINL